MNRYAEHYKGLATGVGTAPIAEFSSALPFGTGQPHTPLHSTWQALFADADQRAIFDAIESYLVRRTVCGLSRKNYNKVFALQLKKLFESGADAQESQGFLGGLL